MLSGARRTDDQSIESTHDTGSGANAADLQANMDAYSRARFARS
jgi:hypothetical protein